jgi:hypothetical protein
VNSRLHRLTIRAFAAIVMLVLPLRVGAQVQTPDVGNPDVTAYLPKVIQDLMKRSAENEDRIRAFDARLAAKDAELGASTAQRSDLQRQLRRTERINDRLFAAVNSLTTQLLAKNITSVEKQIILDQLIRLTDDRATVPPNIAIPLEMSPAVELIVRNAAAAAARDEARKLAGDPFTVLFSEPLTRPASLDIYRPREVRIRVVPTALNAIPAEFKNVYRSFTHVMLRAPVQPEIREDDAVSVGDQSTPKLVVPSSQIENEWTARVKPVKLGAQAIRIVLNGNAGPPLIYPISVKRGNWLALALWWIWYWATKPAVIAVAAAIGTVLAKLKDISESASKLWKFLFPQNAPSEDPSGHE